MPPPLAVSHADVGDCGSIPCTQWTARADAGEFALKSRHAFGALEAWFRRSRPDLRPRVVEKTVAELAATHCSGSLSIPSFLSHE